MDNKSHNSQILNIACGKTTSLNDLYQFLLNIIENKRKIKNVSKINYLAFRKGDILHSLADISKAKNILGFKPAYDVKAGLQETIDWYLKNISNK